MQFAVHVAPIVKLVHLAGQPVLFEGAVALGAPEQVLSAQLPVGAPHVPAAVQFTW